MANKGIAYLVEQRFYSRNDLAQRIGTTSLGWLSKLPAGVVQTDGRSYQFKYVGLLGVGGQLVVLLPKYMTDRSDEDLVRKDEVRQVMQVLRVCNDQYAGFLATRNEAGDVEEFFNGEPAVAMALIEDYLEYGYWSNTEQIVTQSAGTRVDWQRTMDRTMPLVSNDGVLYPVVYSVQQQTLADSVILRLHKWAVRHCLQTYQDVLPGFDCIDYDPEAAENLETLGSRDYLIMLLEQELRVSYRDVHVRMLRTLIQLVSEHHDVGDETGLILFGTTAFYQVWEKACKVALRDMSDRVKNLLPVPEWQGCDGLVYVNEQNRLIPDVVWYDDECLLIIDAKYYNVRFDPGQVKQNPGIADVSKQIIYQQSLCDILKIDQSNSLNAFVFPRSDLHGLVEKEADWLWGFISSRIPGWDQYKIAVLLVPPTDMFRCFLEGSRLIEPRRLVSIRL